LLASSLLPAFLWLLPGVDPTDYLAGVTRDRLHTAPLAFVLYAPFYLVQPLFCRLPCQAIGVPALHCGHPA
jgi:hypothetical protein